MERINNPKCLWFIFVFILMSTVNSYSAGFITDWEPFKTKRELGFSVDVGPNIILFSKDEYPKMENGMAVERDTADRKDDGSWSFLKFRKVRISFSRTMMDKIQKDVNQKSGDGSDKLNAIKSLPSTVLNTPYRDTFESIGKIFEPQVNLSIEF